MTLLTHAQISVASSKVFCKLGNGTVRDLTLDTNTVYTHPKAIQCNAATEINSLKSSVSSGKQQVANAITGKGVSASGNDSFATLANKIGQIASMPGGYWKVTADSGGGFTIPALGFTPKRMYAMQERSLREEGRISIIAWDFTNNRKCVTDCYDYDKYTPEYTAAEFASSSHYIRRPSEWNYNYENSVIYIVAMTE